MDCSLPGSSVHWDFPGKSTGAGCPFHSPGDLPDPGIEPGSPALHADALLAEPSGKLQSSDREDKSQQAEKEARKPKEIH